MNTDPKLYLIPSPLSENAVVTYSERDESIILSVKVYFYESLKPCRRAIYQIWKKNNFCGDKSNFDSIQWEPIFTQGRETVDFLFQKELLKKSIEEKFSIGLITDAGCPAVADPGSKIVAMAHELGLKVAPFIGPSSIILALMSSGFNGQKFSFKGYLPTKPQDRKATIKKLESKLISEDETQIFIETPYRNEALFTDLLSVLNPKTKICIAMDLTAPSELIHTFSVVDWRKMELPIFAKKPTIFLIGK